MDTHADEGSIRLHYIHPNHVLGDVHPFFENGTWYLYYLLPGGKFQAALLTSRDMVNWEEAALRHEGPPAEQPYYVLGVFKDSTGAYWSYHGSAFNVMKGQTSRDLQAWRNAPLTNEIPSQTMLYEKQSDPYVFWNEDEKKYWCLMTCKVWGGTPGLDGAIGFASSVDLTGWEGRGNLWYPRNTGRPECPQEFKIGATWYLLASLYNPAKGVGKPSYWRSANPAGPWQTPVPDALDGEDLCAAQVANDGSRWILLGWIPLTTGNYWGGHLNLPREVYPLPDGSLATRLDPRLGAAIRGVKVFPADARNGITWGDKPWKGTGAEVLYDGIGPAVATLDGRYARIDMEVTVRSEGKAGIRLGPEGQPAVVIAVDFIGRRMSIASENGETSAVIALRPDESLPLKLRIVAEGTIVEAFLNDRYSLAARISATLVRTTIGLQADGPSSFADIAVHRLATREEVKDGARP